MKGTAQSSTFNNALINHKYQYNFVVSNIDFFLKKQVLTQT